MKKSGHFLKNKKNKKRKTDKKDTNYRQGKETKKEKKLKRYKNLLAISTNKWSINFYKHSSKHIPVCF